MGPRPSLASDFYSLIENQDDRFGFLSNLPNSDIPVFESDHLDLKVGSRINIPRDSSLEKSQKLIWSKSLSAMANSGGGVLIWGIEAKWDANKKLDSATSIAPVTDVDQFISWLKGLSHNATDPPVPGVQYLRVPKSQSNLSGFVVCLIPESPYKPHRSEIAENKPFLLEPVIKA